MTHPITLPLELVQKWVQATESKDCIGAFPTNFEQRICTAAAQWGADRELDACCEWLQDPDLNVDTYKLRDERRPKPPSLKEQALELARPAGTEGAHVTFGPEELALIRRALEALPE